MSEKESPWWRLLSLYGKNYAQNKESLQEFLKVNRGYISEIPHGETVIVLFSGGMDSTILIDRLITAWDCKVILLFYKRDAKNEIWEEQAVDFFYDFYKKRYPTHILELIKLAVQIPIRLNKEHLDRERQKVMGLPLRNATFWMNAFSQAVYLSGKYQTTIRTVIVGSIGEDEGSPESGSLALLAGTINVCICMGLWYYQLIGPFLDGLFGKIWAKEDLFVYAEKYQIPIEKTRSCFEETSEPCGKCLACNNRMNAQIKSSKTM